MSLYLHYIQTIDQLLEHKGLKQKICSKNTNLQRQLVWQLLDFDPQQEEEEADLWLLTWKKELSWEKVLPVRACLLSNRPGCLAACLQLSSKGTEEVMPLLFFWNLGILENLNFEINEWIICINSEGTGSRNNWPKTRKKKKAEATLFLPVRTGPSL